MECTDYETYLFISMYFHFVSAFAFLLISVNKIDIFLLIEITLRFYMLEQPPSPLPYTNAE